MIRAKMYVATKTEFWPKGEAVEVKFQVVTSGSEENKLFFHSTPNGHIQMTVKREVADQLEIGREYYIDFTPASSEKE